LGYFDSSERFVVGTFCNLVILWRDVCDCMGLFVIGVFCDGMFLRCIPTTYTDINWKPNFLNSRSMKISWKKHCLPVFCCMKWNSTETSMTKLFKLKYLLESRICGVQNTGESRLSGICFLSVCHTGPGIVDCQNIVSWFWSEWFL